MPWRWYAHLAAGIAATCLGYYVFLIVLGLLAGVLLGPNSSATADTIALGVMTFVAGFISLIGVAGWFRGAPPELLACGLVVVLLLINSPAVGYGWAATANYLTFIGISGLGVFVGYLVSTRLSRMRSERLGQ